MPTQEATIAAPPSPPTTEPLELRAVEVMVNLTSLVNEMPIPVGVCMGCGSASSIEWDSCDDTPGVMDALFEELRRRGIDTGRTFEISVSESAMVATARQDPWRGE